MKSLFKVIIVIALCSASTFILVQMTGLITIDKIELWFNQVRGLSPIYIATIVISLMFIDLFISIPTLATIILAGHFMGYRYGALTAITGLMIAGTTGYILGRIFGDKILRLILKDSEAREEVKTTFNNYGFTLILLSRAIAILPEVTTCLAGMSKMSYSKFITAWSISIIPYSVLAAYAGSLSTVRNPEPAIIVTVIISVILWTGWFFFNKAQRSN